MISLNLPKNQHFRTISNSSRRKFRRFNLSHWHTTCSRSRWWFESRPQALRIEEDSGDGRTTIRLIGHFQVEHIEELQKHLRQNGPRLVLDLRELTLVDVDVVRFLGTCEAGGVEVVNCSPYIREWMNQERKV